MARSQTVSIAILGIWLGWTLFMWFMAGASFRTVGRVLGGSNPQIAEAKKSAGELQTRALLRYLASELNRTVFAAYGWAQIVLGVGLLFLLTRQAPRDAVALALAGAMLSLVVLLTFVVTPQIVELGRSLDWVPRNPEPPALAHFRSLHRTYTVFDGTKLLLGIGLLLRWVFAR